MYSSRTSYQIIQRQCGAAMMIMIIIMVLGIIAMLAGALSNSSLKSARDQKAADVLVQARDALIGRAISDANHPGSLPCPDTSVPGSPNSGTADSFIGNICPNYIGRLPWKTLGIPELVDGNGEDLWYALSPTLRDNNAAQPINSDTQGWLSLTGNISLSNVAAIVFAPGAPLCGQNQSANNAIQYLEALSSVSATSPTPAVVRTASNDCTNSPYNDNLLAITTDQVFQPVEKRIAREVKACLDEYAASSAHKYPWAATVSPLSYAGSYSTLFGRIPYLQPPNTSTSPASASATNLSAALSALQTAFNNFVANGNATNQTALISAGIYVQSLQNSIPAISSTIDTAGDWGKEFAVGQHTQSGVQGKIDSANTALAPYLSVSPDPSMSASWTPSCTTLFSSSYWTDWKELVFYQVASSYQPGATSPLSCGSTCLSITVSGNNAAGSGSYRAVVIVARKDLGALPRNPTNVSDYLELINLKPSQLSPTNPYNTFRPTDPSFQTVNDLAQCLDANTNCI